MNPMEAVVLTMVFAYLSAFGLLCWAMLSETGE
jgi:hypothetical protein